MPHEARSIRIVLASEWIPDDGKNPATICYIGRQADRQTMSTHAKIAHIVITLTGVYCQRQWVNWRIFISTSIELHLGTKNV